MNWTILIVALYLPLSVFSQHESKVELYDLDGTYYYSVSHDSNDKLLIFLHGGVNNPYFDQNVKDIKMDYLIEGNLDFLNSANEQGFDIIIPIANGELNWLDQPESVYRFIEDMMEGFDNDYQEIYISGFSDGGTGSFKIFYTHPDFFDGLIIFNGYPQHSNFYRSVDYKSGTNKKILFIGTTKDEVIPYEFLITEYCSQKSINPNTFIYLTDGKHSFKSYSLDDFKEVFDILNSKNSCLETKAIQGFIKNDQLIELYPYRKKIVRQYNYGKDIYLENQKQLKQYK